MFVQEELKKETTLVVLDGVDENTSLHQIVSQATVKSHKLLLTARPSFEHEKAIPVDVIVTLHPMTDALLEDQLNREDDDIATSIKKSPEIWELGKTPGNLDGLCDVLANYHRLPHRSSVVSKAFAFEKLMTTLWKRYDKKPGIDPTQMTQNECFDTLGRIALQASQRVPTQFSHSLFENREIDNLLAEDPSIDTNVLLQRGFLVHKERTGLVFRTQMMQQFLIGRILAKRFTSEDENEKQQIRLWMHRHKYDNDNGNVFVFMAEKLCNMGGDVAIKNLLNELDNEMEMIGLRHFRLRLTLVNEYVLFCGLQHVNPTLPPSSEFQNFDSVGIAKQLKEWIRAAFRMTKKTRVGENEDGVLIQEVIDLINTFPSVVAQVTGLVTAIDEIVPFNEWKRTPLFLKAIAAIANASNSEMQHLTKILRDACHNGNHEYVQTALGCIRILANHSKHMVPSMFEMIRDVQPRNDNFFYTVFEIVGLCPNLLQNAMDIFIQACRGTQFWVRRRAMEIAELLTKDSGDLTALSELSRRLLDVLKQSTINSSPSLIEIIPILCGACPEYVDETLNFLFESMKLMDESTFDIMAKAVASIARNHHDKMPTIVVRLLSGQDRMVWPTTYPVLKELVQQVNHFGNDVFLLMDPLMNFYEVRNDDVYICALMIRAARQLAEIGDERFIPRLTVLINDQTAHERLELRELALETIESLVKSDPKHATVFLNAMKRVLSREEVWKVDVAATHAAAAFMKQDPSSHATLLPFLKERLKGADDTIRAAAAEALKNAYIANSVTAKSIKEYLELLLGNDEIKSSQGAVICIGEIVAEMPKHIPDLAKHLISAGKETELLICSSAISALNRIADYPETNPSELVEVFSDVCRRDERALTFPSISGLTACAKKDTVNVSELVFALEKAMTPLNLMEWKIFLNGIETALDASLATASGLCIRLLEEPSDEIKEVRNIRQSILEKRSVQDTFQWCTFVNHNLAAKHILRRLYRHALVKNLPFQPPTKTSVYIFDPYAIEIDLGKKKIKNGRVRSIQKRFKRLCKGHFEMNAFRCLGM